MPTTRVPDGQPLLESEEVKSTSDVAPPMQAAASVSGMAAATADEGIGGRIGRYRWVICALLFFATTINYLDRQVFSLVAPTLVKEFGWSKTDYGVISSYFQWSYAFGLLFVGRFMDWVGTRKGFSLAVLFWSLAAMGHALASSLFGFKMARAALGVTEAGNFPAAVKTVAEWFPKKERALATGIFNAGANVGATLAPVIVWFLLEHFAWQSVFIMTGAVGLLWLFFWIPMYRAPEEHPRVGKAELAHIQSDSAEPATGIPWISLIPKRQTWAFALGKFMTDPVWWFFLTWLPMYLKDSYKMDISTYGPSLVLIYLMADFGSVGGGYISSYLMKKGATVNRARKTAMLVCALCVLPIIFASKAATAWVAVPLIGLAAAAHQGWSANLFTLVSDTFPRRAVGSVVGIGGLCGAVGGALFQPFVGKILDATNNNYYIPFLIAGTTYLLALGVIHLLVPRLDSAGLDLPAPQP